MKKSIVFASLLAGTGALALPVRQAQLTVGGYSGESTLTDFPVLVRITEYDSGTGRGIQGFSYADCASGGSDISFALADGTILPHEVDTWDTAGESLVWVRLPSLSGTTTSFYLRWNDAAPPAYTPSAVWSGADFAGVWHMNGASGVVADATGHGLDATPEGNTANSIGVNGAIGTARRTATEAERGYLSIPSYDSLGLESTFVISGWFNLDGIVKEHRLFSRKASYNVANGWEVETPGTAYTTIRARAANDKKFDCTIPSLKSTWVHLAFIYNDASLLIYTNAN